MVFQDRLIIEPFPGAKSREKRIPLSLTIRSSSGYPGEYQFPTDSEHLMSLLRKQTDLADSVLTRFEEKIMSPNSARLLGVELNEGLLSDIGFFID